MRKQTGFAAVEMVLGAVVVVVIGFAVYTAYNNHKQAANNASTSQTASAPQINTTSDLDSAAKAVDDTDVDNSADSSQLSQSSNSF